MASTDTNHDFLDPPKDSVDDLGSLGHYRVIRELGKGGMGFVFLAEDTRLKRDVALKVMNKKIAATPGSRKRFISEARSMAAVHHDNVATIFEVGEHNHTPFMAMELLEGATLENYREQHGPPDYHRIIQFARDIARGLRAAHSQGIVHRDIKPANIWLDTKTDRIKILDFGLALARTPVDQLSGRGAVIGTPGYLSPEQARSEPLDDRSDLYSVGVVLYELATGSLPLKAKTVAEQLIAILAHAPKPIRERNDQIPQPLADLIHRLMAKEPRDRYSDAAELEAALDKVEVECESKSEVAQAINQLQLGLEQAVKKKQTADDSGAFAFGNVAMLDSEQTPPNPFDSLPDALPASTPLTTGATSSGVHAAVTVVPHSAPPTGPLGKSSLGQGARAPKPDAAATSSGSSKMVLWIAVGVGAAVLLLLIPAVAYFSSTSAIARQQGQNAVIIAPDAPQSAADYDRQQEQSQLQNNQSAADANKTPPNKQRPNQNKPGTNSKPGSAANPLPAALPELDVTPVVASTATKFGGDGAKWLINEKNANGWFKKSELRPEAKKIDGWTLTTAGRDGGWGTSKNQNANQADTFAFAGAKSEILLSSEPLDYQVQTGDRFRVGANVGGKGNGMSDYRMILGFRDASGNVIRYQVAETANQAQWDKRQKPLRFEYQVDESVAGKKPFVEFIVSNKKRNRSRAMIGRIMLTVVPAPEPSRTAASMEPKSTPQPKSTPEPKPVPEKSPQIVRRVEIKTSEEGGADTTVKRSGGSNESLGDKPAITIQTRNGTEVQHIYLRFPIGELRGAGQNPNRRNRNQYDQSGNRKAQPVPVLSAALRLRLVGSTRLTRGGVRLYGLDTAVSDEWKEDRLVWSRSLSAASLDKLPLLAEQAINPDELVLSISSDQLAEFVANAGEDSVTLILTGSGGNQMINFRSKESGIADAQPTLLIGLGQ